MLSLLIGRDVVEGLGLDIKGSSKTLEYSGRSQPLLGLVAGHYCATLSPERYAGLLKLETSPDPPSSRLRPRRTSLVPKSSMIKTCTDRWKFVSLSVATTIVDSSNLIVIPQQTVSDSDKRVVHPD